MGIEAVRSLAHDAHAPPCSHNPSTVKHELFMNLEGNAFKEQKGLSDLALRMIHAPFYRDVLKDA